MLDVIQTLMAVGSLIVGIIALVKTKRNKSLIIENKQVIDNVYQRFLNSSHISVRDCKMDNVGAVVHTENHK